MATTAQINAIAALYVGYFNRAPDPAGLQFWIDQIENGREFETIAADFAASPEATALYPYLTAPDVASSSVFIANIYQNLFNRVPDEAGLEFWSDVLDSGSVSVADMIAEIIKGAVDSPDATPPTLDATTLENKVEAGLDFAADAANVSDFDIDEAANKTAAIAAVDDVTDDEATVDAAKAATDAFLFSTEGNTFTLTEGSDQLPGLVGSDGTTDNSADDLILAGTSNIGGATNTLGSGDNLNGGEGFDTLRVLDGAGATFTPTLSNIESVEVQATGGTTNVNMINATGVEQAWNYRSTSNVNYTNLQNAVVAGVFDSNTRNELTYEDGVDLGDAINMVVDGAGVASNFATIRVNSDDAANVTDLNITTGDADSYLEVDVDSAPGAGTPAAFENLTIAGAGGIVLREENNQGETDFVTMVDATGLEGFLDLELGSNDENIDFDGGNGDTTLVTGNGDSDILTGEGDDSITVGNGVNTINTGAGADSVVVGTGNNVVDTGADNDVVDITAGGDESVMLGDGDDVLLAGSTLTDDDAIEAGDGEDTLVVDVAHADAFTANGDVDAVVNGFEALDLNGTVAAGDSFTVNLDNIDDIDYVITDGTDAGFGSQNEIQTIDFNATGSQDGYVRISVLGQSIDVKVDANLTNVQVASAVANAVQVAIGSNQLPAGLIGAVVSGDNVNFEFDSALGDIGNSVSVTEVTDTASLANLAATEGTSAVLQQQSITVTSNAGWLLGDATVNFTNMLSGGSLNVTIGGGSSLDEGGQAIADAINAAPTSLYNATYNANTNSVSITAKAAGPLTAVNDNFGGLIVSAAPAPAGVTPLPETQVFDLLVNGSAVGTYAADGYLEFGNFVIEVPAGTTVDELGALIVANKASIVAEDMNIADIDYNTATGELTVAYTTAAGDVSNTVFTNLFDGNANSTANPGSTGTVQNGDTGTAAGNLTLNYTAAGGTLELGGANLGTTNVVIDGAAAGTNDDFNIVLATSADHTGVVDVTGVETLTVETQAAAASDLGLVANDAETLVVTGTAGVDFIDDFANLTSVDASALVIETDDEGVSVTTNTADDATLTGSAGEDVFFSGSGDDVIMGGTGDDEIHGRGGDDMIMGGEGDDNLWGNAGTDELTGGAGDDTFHYTAVSDSQGVTVDTITDFMSGEDTIDFSAISTGVGSSYTGEANGYGAVLTSLQNTGDSQAVLDTSTNTLYLDVDGNGVLDSQDMAIDLAGVTALDDTDFAWV